MNGYARAATVCAMVAVLAGCLPIDTTPPAEVSVTLRTSELSAFIPSSSMADGWEVSFDRSLLTVSSVALLPVDGSEFGEGGWANYARIMSLTGVERQKVALLFGRGACAFRYSIAPLYPDMNVVLGPGVTEADAEFLLEQARAAQLPENGTNPYGEEAIRAPGFYVEGTARNGERQKRFRWLFWDAEPEPGAGCPEQHFRGLRLESGGAATIELLARGEALFMDSSNGGELSFDRFAEADADADGTITTTELENAVSTDLATPSLYLRTASALREALTGVPSGLTCL